MNQKLNKILIIDDNEEILIALKIFLRQYVNEIITLNAPPNLHNTIENHDFDLIILDMNFRAGERTGNEGLFWIGEILKIKPDSIVICVTAYGAVQLAVKAIQNGAADFIEKPWDEEQFLAAILRAGKLNESKKRLNSLKEKNLQLIKQSSPKIDFIKGVSPQMKGIWHTIEKIAPTDANILITGENGTGKELVARQIHQYSLRNTDAFITVDLGSLTPSLFESEMFGYTKGAFTNALKNKKGWFEVADQGTIFLDEIANLNLEQQAKLLSAIQRKEISPVGSTEILPLNVRIISATNADLKNNVLNNKFREDLLFRLNTITIELPALRNRKEDIPLLFEFYFNHFKWKYNKKDLIVSTKLVNRLVSYSWPGNIRELKHVIERAVILSENSVLKISDFYIDTDPKISISNEDNPQPYNLEQNEKLIIQKAINISKGNYTKAAEVLGISRRTLYNKIERYGI
jgi:DNA-binding NtrC family response regulator